MKKSFVLLYIVILFVSCGYLGTKKTIHNNVEQEKITVIEYKDNYHVAYTNDGHTMIYGKDSSDNYIVYYAKFYTNYKNRDNDRIKEVIVRTEIDSSLDSIKSIIFFTGGIFCKKNDLSGYDVCYFDEDMSKDSLQLTEISSGQGQEIDILDITKRIIQQLNTARQIVIEINNSSAKGWHNIVSILNNSQEMLTYDVILSDVLHDSKISKRISKISRTTDWLNQYNSYLREEMNKEQ